MTAPAQVVQTGPAAYAVTVDAGSATVVQQNLGVPGPTGAPGGAFALSSPEVATRVRQVGDPVYSPLTVAATGAPLARTAADRAADSRVPEDFVSPADNGDWALAWRRALDYCTPRGLTLRLNKMYGFMTTLTVGAGDSIVGNGILTGCINMSGTSMRLINGDNIAGNAPSNTVFDNFTVDDNQHASTSQTKRAFQLSDASNVLFTRMNVVNSTNWHVSFIRCTQVRGKSYRMRWDPAIGGNGGGVDGIHFLDCTDFSLIGADIVSGDDCVGATVQTIGQAGGVIRDVVGSSKIASIVTVGYEDNIAPNATLYTNRIVIDGITSTTTPNLADSVVKVLATATDSASNLTVTHNMTDIYINNVTGTAAAHAVRVQGTSVVRATNVRIRNVDVISTKQHGVYLQNVDQYTVQGRATALGQGSSALFSGFVVFNCGSGTVEPISVGSSLYGVVIQNSGKATIISPYLWNCGAGSANDGGGIRITTPQGPVTVTSGSIGADNTGIVTYGIRCDATTWQVAVAPMDMTNVNAATSAGMRGMHKAPFVTTAPPTATDDASKGWTQGQSWVDSTAKVAYTLTDPTTGAAVWRAQGAASQGSPRRTGAKFEAYTRAGATFVALSCLTSGTETVSAVWLAAGTVVSKIGVYAASAAASPTNQWFTLRDASGNLLAVTADGTTAAWATNSEKQLAIANTVSGSSFTANASVTVPSDGVYYVGVQVTATTVPSLVAPGGAGNSGIVNLSPTLCSRDAAHTGLTGPTTAPPAFTFSQAQAAQFWAWVG